MINRRQFISSASLALVGACATNPRPEETWMSYRPKRRVSGSVSIWGHGSLGGKVQFMEPLIAEWEARFRRYHPDAVVRNCMYGTASAIGAIYSGQGDLALMGREIWPSEIRAFEEVLGRKPVGINILTGSHAVRNKGYALSVFVHKDNPIECLTLAELDAIFGREFRRGRAQIDTWQELTGTPCERSDSINVYGIDLSRGFARYFEEAVFLEGRIWNPKIIEFADAPGSKGGHTDGGHKVLEAVASDPFGIGYSGMLYSHPDVKPVALAVDENRPYVLQSEATVRDRSYPLTRSISMYMRGKGELPSSPAAIEFVRFLLSEEGQSAAELGDPGYLSLTPAIAARELECLEAVA